MFFNMWHAYHCISQFVLSNFRDWWGLLTPPTPLNVLPDPNLSTLSIFYILMSIECLDYAIALKFLFQLFQTSCASAVNCCTFVDEHEIFAGCHSGELFQFDLRNLSAPVSVISIGNSPIHYISRFFNHLTLCRGLSFENCSFNV